MRPRPVSSLRIVVYAIARDEAKHVERFCASAKGADEIVVADTGSADRTVDLLKEHGATVQHLHLRPWRFDDARNASLALLPADADVCISLDLDEVLVPGWREEIERLWTPGTTRLRYKYDWGNGVVFFAEKIHARHGYRWHHPCHEYIRPDRITEQWASTAALLIQHLPDASKPRSQYLDLLRLGAEEDPLCAHNSFYYARELSFAQRWDEAIAEATRYLTLPKATWPNERCYALRVLGAAHSAKGATQAALKALRSACSEAPDTREPWCDLALEAYKQARWAECYGAAMTALGIAHRELVYTTDPEAWGVKPHDLAAVAAWNLGLYTEARRHAQAAVEFDPNDLRLRRNLELINEQAA